MSTQSQHDGEHGDRLVMYAMSTLSSSDASAMEAHLATCSECRDEVARLRSTVDTFVDWPRAVVRPTKSNDLWKRLSDRLEEKNTDDDRADANVVDDWKEPDWQEASPGLWYQLLSKDAETHRVTMLVRLEPMVEYPPHTHAGVEELHLLDGELWIDDRKLYPGDYSRADSGTSDKRVWSETGCTCVLITSHLDILK